MKQDLYTITELCDLFKCGRSSVWKWIKHGELNCSQIGTRKYFTHEDIQDFLNRHKLHQKKVYLHKELDLTKHEIESILTNEMQPPADVVIYRIAKGIVIRPTNAEHDPESAYYTIHWREIAI